MGSANSTMQQSPISFSQDLVDSLADNAAAPTPDAARQDSLDVRVRARIQAELASLRAEEQAVRDQIHAALERENLDRERALAADPDPVNSSPALMADLDELRAKVDRFHARRDPTQFPVLQAAGAALVACYRDNTATPLDCWQQVEGFKASVADMEQVP
ncbi:hypothetical protein B0H10DRAFT_344710 [Mycena sp. CBHHK59/15]|nr:hypothetical protein B0H10DRAFT_344710 [Mycena sp. CBHHK59/15]